MGKMLATPKLKDMALALYRVGWKKVIVNYSGSGDSCHDFEVTVVNEEGRYNVDAVIPNDLGLERHDLVDAMWDLLPRGFEINTGGYGNIELDTKTFQLDVCHEDYEEDDDEEDEDEDHSV